ncbi:MAG TPA: hypothetical protein H9729_07565 [Candidatus Borkfalkia excrementigallinarum]|uniref:Cellobiose phosphorylase n=1 Tax=Candidatus Borkfalkia excrementigallinarum TaxID=2838506 RepID=A0A9D2CT98_9FIRM|nr:hypothetical protein [Candidatus Borkfalkia excrementigallinarum]
MEGFDVKNGTYTIEEREKGKDWGNFIFNDLSYILYVSHLGDTNSKFLNKDAVQVTVNQARSNFVYLRDERTKRYWDVAGFPTGAGVRRYKCVHGQKFTEISSVCEGIEMAITYAVAPEDTYEIWQVRLKNRSRRARDLSVFATTVFDLNGYAQPVYYSSITTSATEYLPEANAVYNGLLNPYRPHARCNGFILSELPVFAYDGNAEKFIGTAGSFTRPRVLEEGRDCTGSLATVRARGGILQSKLTLQAGEERVFHYLIGLTDGKQQLLSAAKEMVCGAAEIVSRARKDLSGYTLRTECPVPRLNGIMNFWAEKQVRFCSLGKKAVRDNAQLGMAMLNYDVNGAKTIIDECVAHQYADGHAVLTWYPYLEQNIYSDPSMWLIFAVCDYIKETGDFEYLQRRLSYLDGGEDSVYGHLRRAVDWFERADNYGAHGLPRIHHADWNDALNIPDERAESVFMGMGICWAYAELADLARYLGEADFAEYLMGRKAALADIVNETAYNGEYYVRAFSKFGVVGDKTAEHGGKIYINPQSWSILADVVPQERLASVLAAIDGMETPEGIPLCAPAYDRYDETVGRMSGMLPGVYENGGIYNHAGCFKVMADCKLHRGENAVGTFLKIVPDGPSNPSSVTTTEPYVFTNCYLKHPSVDMQVGFSWQTGTSAWGLKCYYEGILGLQRTYAGLRVSPSLPASWKTVTAERVFRGDRLKITYHNEAQSGNVRLVADGRAVEGDVLPVFGDGKVHAVDVYC